MIVACRPKRGWLATCSPGQITEAGLDHEKGKGIGTVSGAQGTIRQTLVVFAKNKKRVSAFYRETLGLQAVEEDPSHDLLQGPGVELVIHSIPKQYAEEIKITRPPQVREESSFKPAFLVPDLEAVRRAAEATGGFLRPQESAWTFRGATVLDGWDPEGNVVQFRQLDAG